MGSDLDSKVHLGQTEPRWAPCWSHELCYLGSHIFRFDDDNNMKYTSFHNHLKMIKSPASRSFTQPFIQTQIKENTKALRHWPLCGEFTGAGEFPAQRVSYAENVSIWWLDHVCFIKDSLQVRHTSDKECMCSIISNISAWLWQCDGIICQKLNSTTGTNQNL